MGNRNAIRLEEYHEEDGYNGTEHESTITETILQPTTEQTAKRRGRPKGSKNKPKEGSSRREKTSTIILEEETLLDSSDTINEVAENIGEATTKAVKNSSFYKKDKKKGAKFYSEKEAAETAEIILGTVEGLAVGLVGDEAAFNVVESTLLRLSLPKYLESMEISTVEKTSKFLFPIMGLVGVSVYGLRIASILIEKKQEQEVKQDIEAERMKQAYKEAKEENNIPTTEKEVEKMGNDVEWSKTKDNRINKKLAINF